MRFDRYIVGADVVHHMYLPEFRKQYPDAKLIANEEVPQKQKGLKLNGGMRR